MGPEKRRQCYVLEMREIRFHNSLKRWINKSSLVPSTSCTIAKYFLVFEWENNRIFYRRKKIDIF